MKKHGRKLTAALLALVLVLGLAACGGGEDGGDVEQLSGKVYVPEYKDLDVGLDYINTGCCDGDNVYVVGSIHTETEETDPETGEKYTSYESRTAIFRVSIETGEASELENFDAPAQGDYGYSDIQSICPGAEGTLWIREDSATYTFDLPEDFDEATGSRWEYMTGQEDSCVMRNIDSTGAELGRFDLKPIMDSLGEDSYLYSNSIAFDGENNCYIAAGGSNGGKVFVLDSTGAQMFTVECGEGVNGDGLAPLANGGVGMVVSVSNPGGETVTYELREIDTAKKDWGTAYSLSRYVSDPVRGSGDYLFCFQRNDSLYGYIAEPGEGGEQESGKREDASGNEEGDAGADANKDKDSKLIEGREEKILSWVSADIKSDDIRFYSVMPDGRVMAMTQNWESDENKTELAILTEADPAALPEKTTLTLAAMYLDQDVRNRVIDFNRSSTTHRIEVKDYSEYNTDDTDNAYEGGLTKLNTEIIAGKVPDILCANNLPIRRYAAKGLLEDLWPMIENDPDLGRDALMSHVLECAEIDGKLYNVMSSFAIRTVTGSRKVVGDEMGWTMDELMAALDTMPEGCAIFGESDTKSGMLSTLMWMNLSRFVDWTTGKCSFDSDDFKSILEFCNTFPAEFDWENYDYESADDEPTRIMKGMQMLRDEYLYGLEDTQMTSAMFGGKDALIDYEALLKEANGSSVSYGTNAAVTGMVKDERFFTYIGYPTESGIGSVFEPAGSSLAISSQCKDKDAAWSFVRQILLPAINQEDESIGGFYSGFGFPINKADFDYSMKKAMEKTYVTDENGNNVLDAEGNPIEENHGGYGYGNSLMIWIRAVSQTEYDQFMELYNAIDSFMETDTAINEIVAEQAGAYFSGDKSLDETATLIQNRVDLYVNENR